MLILIFRPFFGWSLHSKLQGHALAVRAQKVCTEEATKVNEFFRQYERAFNFQNQTYLVSYCVYTAATIDIQQIRHEDPVLATAATNRLSTTLKMLESEAKQTPGIKRSIDIIKSHLTQHPQMEAQSAPARYSLRHNHPPASASGVEIETPSWLLDNQMNQITPNMEAAPQFAEEDDIGSLMTQAMDMETSWGDWGFSNAGGGFVPENDSGFDPCDDFNLYHF